MKTVIAGAWGECVHVAGVMNFLRLAEAAGWRTVFLGLAVPVEEFLKAVRREKADMVGVSHQLTPETGERLLADFVTGLVLQPYFSRNVILSDRRERRISSLAGNSSL